MAIAALATALFWGLYGPLLTWGHQTMVVMEGDKAVSYGRLRPFICVGVAYLVVAIIGPALLIGFGLMEKGEGLLSGWSMTGIWWSLIAGAAGAMGALFLLVALNYAPVRPSPALYVMPLVFGCAPVVNTLFTMWHKRAWNLNPFFLAGLILVVVGAVTVLATAQLNVGSKEASKTFPPSTPDESEPAPAAYSVEESFTERPQG
jgi:hypothetical protein